MALDVKISFSWTDYCRLCLLDSGIMLPIFEEEGLNRQLPNKIEACLKIVTYEGDPLPRRICHKCLFKLNQLHEFQAMAFESLQRLKVHLLPLKHVPAVQNYLDQAKIAPKYEDEEEDSSYHQHSLIGNPLNDTNNSRSSSQRPSLRVKKEHELLASSVLHSQIHSPPDSTSLQSTLTDTAGSSSGRVSQLVGKKLASQSQECSASSNGVTYLSASLDSLDFYSADLSRKEEADGATYTLRHKRTACNELQKLNSTKTASIPYSKPGPYFTKVKGKKKHNDFSLPQPVSCSTQWVCVFCDLYFANKTALTKHMDICLTCSTCSMEFSSLAEKAQHEADTHICVFMDADKKHMRKRCTLCPARYVSNIMLSMHAKYDHQFSQNTVLKPSNGNASFSRDSSDLFLSPDSRGETSHSVTSFAQESKFQCDFLGNNVLGNASGDESDSNHPFTPGPNKNIECEVISKVQGAVPLKEFTCLKCGRLFLRKKRLLHHLKNHDRMTNKCTVCNAAFPTYSTFMRHVRSHHKRKSLVQFTCKVCSEKFESMGILKIHKKTAHMKKSSKQLEPIQTEDDSKSDSLRTVISCKKCPEKFSDDDALMLHLYEHSKEPVKCKKRKVGESAIYEESGFVTPKETPPAKQANKSRSLYPCSGCDLTFNNLEALTRHTCIGKDTSPQACCLDCGQGLIEEEDHECDNKCPQCNKVFRSARGQRVHSFYKHGKGTPYNQEGQDQMESSPSELIVNNKNDLKCSDVKSKDIVCDQLGMTDFAPSAVRVHNVGEMPRESVILHELVTPEPTCLMNSENNASVGELSLNKAWHSPLLSSEEKGNLPHLETKTSDFEQSQQLP